MRILHIGTHLNTGGITTYLLTLVREQVKAGHEVYVWASSGNRAESFRECCKGVIEDIPRCKSELSPCLWLQLPRLVSFLRKHSIQIVHTHTRVAQVLTAAATHFQKIPYISTAHMFYKYRLGRRLFPCWGRAVLAISETMRKGMMDIFGQQNLPPVFVVYNGIDVKGLRAKVEAIDRLTVRTAYGCQEENLAFLALSRLVPVKGVHFLIDAFARVYKQMPSARLLIAGMGDEHYIERLKTQVEGLGLQDVVRFLGNIPDVEKPFKAADVFVAPYLWPEAFGLSILEAMAAGLPVIGSNSGGIAELLGYGSRGLLSQEGNVDDLTRCLLEYAQKPDLRRQMNQVAGQASWEYTSEKMYRAVQQVYDQVVSKAL